MKNHERLEKTQGYHLPLRFSDETMLTLNKLNV